MNRSHKKIGYSCIVAAAILFFAGCAEQATKPAPSCPGKRSVTESLYYLLGYADAMQSFKAHGHCYAKFYVDGKLRRENFAVKLWFNPRNQVRLHGDVAFNPRGIDLGSNEEVFWLAMKPKEIGSGYFWGQWSQQNSLGKVPVHPEILLEALGVIAIGRESDWSLTKEGDLDVLSKRNAGGSIVKKVYVPRCDYRVSKIEYFDTIGRIIVSTELGYKKSFRNVSVPSIVKMVTNMDGEESTFRITLASAKSFDFTEQRKKAFFTRHEPKGFKHVYRIINGKVIRQPEQVTGP